MQTYKNMGKKLQLHNSKNTQYVHDPIEPFSHWSLVNNA